MIGLILLVTVSFAQVREPVPVLCYHGFADDTSVIRGKLTETYARFEEMLKFLKENNYESVFPEEIETNRRGTGKRVILTFDDGRKEQLRAAQMMQAYGMRGIFFVIPSRLFGEQNQYLTNADLDSLASWRHQIGVHGYSHRSMVESPAETEAVRTVALGVVKGAMHLQRLFPSFAYPFGHYDSSMVDLGRAGYRYLHTVDPGYWDGRSALIPRMLVTSDKPMGFFQDYIRRSAQFKPSLISMTKTGASTNTVLFQIVGSLPDSGLEIIAVSADKEGYLYTSHSAGEVISVEGSILSFNLRKYLQHFFQETRRVLSYAFVGRDRTSFYYVSSGQSNWVEE